MNKKGKPSPRRLSFFIQILICRGMRAFGESLSREKAPQRALILGWIF
jgi:hypothetical protein